MPVFASNHTSRAFESELDDLRAAMFRMGERCSLALRTAFEAFRSGSQELVERVKEIDRAVDRDEIEIDALILHILAIRQPVASDLRLLTTALKLVTDLERIGDEAVNIADRVEDGPCRLTEETEAALEQMSTEAQEMLLSALSALVDGDETRAMDVLDRDRIVDELCWSTMLRAEQYMIGHCSEVRAAIGVMSIAKYLERVADHATNIAEEVVFMVRGEDVRHGSASTVIRIG